MSAGRSKLLSPDPFGTNSAGVRLPAFQAPRQSSQCRPAVMEEEEGQRDLETVIVGQEEIKSKLADLESSQDRIRHELRRILQGVQGLAGGASAVTSTDAGAVSPQAPSRNGTPGIRSLSGVEVEQGGLAWNPPMTSDQEEAESTPHLKTPQKEEMSGPLHGSNVGPDVDAEAEEEAEAEAEEASRRTGTLTLASHHLARHHKVRYCGFALRPGFVELGRHNKQMQRTRAATFGSFNSSEAAMTDTAQTIRSMTGVAIHPDGVTRFCIDVIMCAVLLFDSLSVPYQLSFEPEAKKGFWYVTNWLALAVWTLDMFAGFLTGYYSQGQVVLNLSLTAWRYFRTVFWVDVFTVGCDWFVMFLPVVLASESAVKQDDAALFRVIRVLKLARLLRLAVAMRSGKLGRMYDKMTNIIVQSGLDKQQQFVLSLTQLMSLILWVTHVGGCVWFALQKDAVVNWEVMNLSEGVNLVDAASGVLERTAEWDYALCFYWAMTAMASGASIMNPTNSAEIVFASWYVLFGLLVGSTLISTLSAMLLDVQISNRERRDSMRQLRLYLYQQGVDVGLALAVEREARKRISQRKRIGAQEVSCLQLLSPAMSSALNYAIYKHPLKHHCFLGTCHILDGMNINQGGLRGNFTREVCGEAVQHYTEIPGTRVFEFGRPCVGPYYIVTGELEYTLKETDVAADPKRSSLSLRGSDQEFDMAHRRTGHNESAIDVVVEPGNWLCELSVWLQWQHAGSLVTRLPSEFFSVAAPLLLRAFSRFEDLGDLARLYGEALCSAAQMEEREQPSDLPLRYELHLSAVLSLPEQGRQMMSLAAVKFLERGSRFRRPRMERLVGEVDNGKCDLVIKDRQVKRVVSMVLVRVERTFIDPSDGSSTRQILVTLGQSMNVNDAKCRLPGGRVRAGELPTEALHRLLGTSLLGLERAGLTGEHFEKVDEIIQLTSAANFGDKELALSMLADLAVGDHIQIGAEGPTRERQQESTRDEPGRPVRKETRVITRVSPQHLTIELDKPLKQYHAESALVTKTTRPSNQLSVESIYVRSVFGATLHQGELPTEFVRPLHRCRRGSRMRFSERSQSPRWFSTNEESIDMTIDPAQYSAFLLVTSPGGDDHQGFQGSALTPQSETGSLDLSSFKGAGSSHACQEAGIPCAWIKEEEFGVLSATLAGQELVKSWVAQLQPTQKSFRNLPPDRP